MTVTQAKFDAALAGVRSQRGPSVDPVSETCLYRSHGRKCNVGWLIPDSQYDARMDYHATYFNLVKVVTGLTADELRALQRAHDNAARGYRTGFMARYNRNMKQLAAEYGLTYLPPPRKPRARKLPTVTAPPIAMEESGLPSAFLPAPHRPAMHGRASPCQAGHAMSPRKAAHSHASTSLEGEAPL